MSEAVAEVPQTKRGSGKQLDRMLTAIILLLVLAVLGLAGLFGYNVWSDYKASQQTNAPTRLVLSLEAAVRKAPNDAMLRVRLGEAYGAAGKYNKAIEQFNQALKVEPNHVGAYLDLGMIAALTDNDVEAERYFKKVVELTDKAQFSKVDQRRENAIYNLGALALQQKHYQEAAGYFKESLRIRKDASDTYLMLARALRGLGDKDGAMENLEIALQFDPGFAEAHYMMGELYRDGKDDVNASYHFFKAAELEPDDDVPREALDAYGPASDWVSKADAALQSGDIEKALEAVLVARNLDPKNVEAAKLHAAILVQREDFKDAIEVYYAAFKLAPSDKKIEAVITGLERDHPKAALDAYRALLKKDATNKDLKKKVDELKNSAS